MWEMQNSSSTARGTVGTSKSGQDSKCKFLLGPWDMVTPEPCINSSPSPITHVVHSITSEPAVPQALGLCLGMHPGLGQGFSFFQVCVSILVTQRATQGTHKRDRETTPSSTPKWCTSHVPKERPRDDSYNPTWGMAPAGTWEDWRVPCINQRTPMKLC